MWADVFQNRNGERYPLYQDQQLTEQPPSGPQTTFSQLLADCRHGLRECQAGIREPRWPALFCELHASAAVSCGKGLGAGEHIIYAAQSV